MEIRAAREGDAEAVCAVLRRSIVELCVPDHGGDAAMLGGWLANKTPENIRRWAVMPGGCLLVAEADGAVLGVGAANAAGEITLNYVSPDARFRGVSKAMLSALESWLRASGQVRATLTSTRTAHRFYLSAGYRDAGTPVGGAGRRMEKAL